MMIMTTWRDSVDQSRWRRKDRLSVLVASKSISDENTMQCTTILVQCMHDMIFWHKHWIVCLHTCRTGTAAQIRSQVSVAFSSGGLQNGNPSSSIGSAQQSSSNRSPGSSLTGGAAFAGLISGSVPETAPSLVCMIQIHVTIYDVTVHTFWAGLYIY